MLDLEAERLLGLRLDLQHVLTLALEFEVRVYASLGEGEGLKPGRKLRASAPGGGGDVVADLRLGSRCRLSSSGRLNGLLVFRIGPFLLSRDGVVQPRWPSTTWRLSLGNFDDDLVLAAQQGGDVLPLPAELGMLIVRGLIGYHQTTLPAFKGTGFLARASQHIESCQVTGAYRLGMIVDIGEVSLLLQLHSRSLDVLLHVRFKS